MKKLALFAMVAVLSLVLTACGGDGGGAAGGREITVELGPNFVFNPKSIDLTKGETVTLKLINKDTAQSHSFVSKDLGVKSKQVAPGKEASINLTAKKDGTVKFICDVPGHEAGGMTGNFNIK